MSHKNGNDDGTGEEEEVLGPVERTEQISGRHGRAGEVVHGVGITQPRAEDLASQGQMIKEGPTRMRQNPLARPPSANGMSAPKERYSWRQTILKALLLALIPCFLFLVLALAYRYASERAVEIQAVSTSELLISEDVVISLQPGASLVLSATTSPTLYQVQQAVSVSITCQAQAVGATAGKKPDPDEELFPYLVAPRRRVPARSAEKNGRGREPPDQAAEALPQSDPPCLNRTGQDAYRCCQTVTELFGSAYEREFARCTEDPNTYRPPAAKGEE